MNKIQTQEEISEFFKEKHEKEQVKKIKKLAMSYQIKLGENKKLFCKKCYSMNLQVLGIKNNMKRVQCRECNYIKRWKVKEKI